MNKPAAAHATHRARVNLALSQFTVPMLSRIYAAFDGDMVAALVLGEIAHRNVGAWLEQHEQAEEPLYDPDQRERLMRPCNALSIAEACNLPRETVRRKVLKLIGQGRVYRNAQGHLYVTPTVGNDYEGMAAQIIEQLLLTAAKLERLLKEQRRLAADPPGA